LYQCIPIFRSKLRIQMTRNIEINLDRIFHLQYSYKSVNNFLLMIDQAEKNKESTVISTK
jgi:hypothetical protein